MHKLVKGWIITYLPLLVFQKRRREDDGDVKKSVRDTLKDVGEVGKGFVKSVYLLKEPTR